MEAFFVCLFDIFYSLNEYTFLYSAELNRTVEHHQLKYPLELHL